MPALNESACTAFRPCVVIPVFNHAMPLRGVLSEVASLNLPVLVVNDGSAPEERQTILQVCQEFQVILFEHEHNRGKGAAVLTGLRQAGQRGFTHAVQIDADGQHMAADIPTFLQVAFQNPRAIVLGRPIFDATAPWERVHGRKLTTALIRLETFGAPVGDGLCGFRVYPVSETLELNANVALSERMGFETDVLVRLLWNDLPVCNVDTKVSYPEGGVSHFRYVGDNWTLIRLHGRLLFGMCARGLAKLFRGRRRRPVSSRSSRTSSSRTSSSRTSSTWFRKHEHGTKLGLSFMLGCYRVGGVRLLELLLYPIVFYFFIKDRDARNASHSYLSRMHARYPELGVRPTPLKIYHHCYHFGRNLVSSLAAWKGDIQGKDIRWHNAELVYELLERGTGALVLSAHIGSLETCRAAHTDRQGLKIVPLMFYEHAQKFRSFLGSINSAAETEVIPIERLNAGVAIQIERRIQSGEFVAVLADRLSANSVERAVPVSFVGGAAVLPEGPFALALALGCPVLMVFSIYRQKTRTYEAFWSSLEIAPQEGAVHSGDRATRRAAMAQRFATQMEAICREEPYQWFNFFQYWTDNQSQ